MIINRFWNRFKQQLEISYIDKEGNRQLFIQRLHHWKTYEYDDKGTCETWDGKKCSPVFKDAKTFRPSEFDMLEHIFDMSKSERTAQIQQEFYGNYPIRLYTYDIETEVSDEFPDPFIAKQRVTSISLVGPDLSCYVMALKYMNEEQCQRLESRYLEFVNNNNYAKSIVQKNIDAGKQMPSVRYKRFESEEALLKYWFMNVIPNITFIAGWNSYRFDRTYLVNRAKNLFGEQETNRMIRLGSPTGQISSVSYVENGTGRIKVPIPMHMVELDYMELVKQYEYAFRPYESYSLDWCGEHIVKANKIKYEGTLQQLYERDYEWYYYYNAVDSLIVQLIHQRTKCIKSPAAVGSMTMVGLIDAMGQVAMTTANLFRVFYNQNKHVVYDYDSIDRSRPDYEGAFCKAVPGLHRWTACFDFKSLYPTQIRTCNFSFENFIKPTPYGPDSLGRYTPRLKWTEEELEQFRKDPNYFVSVNNNVYKNDRSYSYKIMQENNTINGRDRYKYLGQKINAQMLSEIERLIREKEQEESNRS